MKHKLSITIFMLILFFVSQLVGLVIIDRYIDHKTTIESGEVVFKELPAGIERPEVNQTTSFIYILVAIAIGTILVLIIIRFKKTNLWKVWFSLSVILCLTVALSGFIDPRIAFTLALIFGIWKVFRPNVLVHNITEVFIYGGLAVILLPIFNLFSVFALLFCISLYDMYAVWKSKHMVKMAEFQSHSKVFAGMLVPYKKESSHTRPAKGDTKGHTVMKTSEEKNAILGGGDIAFPLIFAGVVMQDIMLNNTYLIGIIKTLIVPVVVTGALALLLLKSKENRYYPAMPFISMGCALGYVIVLGMNQLF